MKILAFDTSTEYCSVAIYLDGDILASESLAERRHSELLLPMIHQKLNEADLELAHLDGLAFGAGPGSFTGLRIACGVAQGLAFASNLPIIGISTLEAIAQQNQHDNIIVAIDARMGEIYHAAYTRKNTHWHSNTPPILCKPENAPALTGSYWIGCGSGFDAYKEILCAHYQNNLIKVNYQSHPHAREIAQLAASQDIHLFCSDPAQATPIYIRNKVALKESER